MSGTNSADRILSILDLFTAQKAEWSKEELMPALGYSRPTLYRYLKLLRESGLLSASQSGIYTLGPRVVELDHLMRRSDVLTRFGTPALLSLTARHRCWAFLVRWYGDRLLCIASESSTDEIEATYPRGMSKPMNRGAIAKVILAYLPSRQLMKRVERHFDDFRAIGLGKTQDEIVASFRAIRRAGVAVAIDEVMPNAAGIAAPIFDRDRVPIGALNLTLPSTELIPARQPALLSLVRDTARSVSRQISAYRESEKDGDADDTSPPSV